MIQIVIFDMAGTTINEDNMVYKCLHRALILQGLQANLEDVLLIAAGKEKRHAIIDMCEHILGEQISDLNIDIIYRSFLELLDEAYENVQLTVFEDFLPLKNYLKSNEISIVFNTGYKEVIARKILSKVGITVGKDIDLLVTADMVENGRPAPDMIIYALEKLNYQADVCLKIGDSIVDILEGKNANVAYTIGITTGAQEASDLAKAFPDKIVNHLSELVPLIDDLNKSL